MSAEGFVHKEGELVGNYVLTRPVGRGAIGEVWKAVHREWPDQVSAIKFSTAVVEGGHLRVEGSTLRSLEHPNIVRVEDQDTRGPNPYLRMEWVEGESLRQRLDREGPLEPALVRKIVVPILQALEHAHGQGVIHGDLKPSNVLLPTVLLPSREEPEEPLSVKVVDFGHHPQSEEVISSLYADEQEREQLVGTVGYLAPEVLRGEEPDASSDLYSLGVVVFELLTGRLPSGMTPPSQLRPELGEDWDEFVSKLLADRELRYSSAEAALAGLKKEPPAAVPAKPRPWWLEPWFAGPMFALSLFLVFFVCIGIRGLPVSVRVLCLIPSLVLGAIFWRGVWHPRATALFWGGGFFGYAMRVVHPALFIAGCALALAGAVWYVADRVRQARRQSSPEAS